MADIVPDTSVQMPDNDEDCRSHTEMPNKDKDTRIKIPDNAKNCMSDTENIIPRQTLRAASDCVSRAERQTVYKEKPRNNT